MPPNIQVNRIETNIEWAEDKGRGAWSGDYVVRRHYIEFSHPPNVKAYLPEETYAEYEDEFRRASYEPFYDILRGPEFERPPYGSSSRSKFEAAQEYYEYFDYSNHLDEFREYMASKNDLSGYHQFMSYRFKDNPRRESVSQ